MKTFSLFPSLVQTFFFVFSFISFFGTPATFLFNFLYRKKDLQKKVLINLKKRRGRRDEQSNIIFSDTWHAKTIEALVVR